MVTSSITTSRGLFHSDKWLFGLMLLSALSALVASVVLSVDAYILAGNPDKVLSCDVNALISCGKVAVQWQANLLGFPNAFIGIICESVVVTIAVAGLSGVDFKRWFMSVAQFAYLCGLTFALWLFYQSTFVIQAFCPWCLLVTLATTVTFFTMMRYSITHDKLIMPSKIKSSMQFMVRNNIDLMVEVLIITGLFSIMLLKYGAALFA